MPELFGGVNGFDQFLAGVFAAAKMEVPSPTLLGALLGPPVIVALIGFLLAWWLYVKRTDLPAKVAESLRGVYRLLAGKYFVDELYRAAIVRPLMLLSDHVLWHAADERMIDGTVNRVGRTTARSGDWLRRLNSGNIRSYASWVIVGALLLTAMLVWVAR